MCKYNKVDPCFVSHNSCHKHSKPTYAYVHSESCWNTFYGGNILN